MTDSLDVVVIGAGVIGLSIARALALAGRDVVVLERNSRIGEETSSRNSEVIHAGIYYSADSLKARLCVQGKELLYGYCADKGVAHSRCGKVIVALNSEQEAGLAALRERANANGVDDLEPLSSADVAALEPALRCSAGLFSPSTGIVDSHELMLSLQGDLEAAGGSVALLSAFRGGAIADDGIKLAISSGAEDVEIHAQAVVNAAGLRATEVANGLAGLDARHVLQTRFVKGTYFVLQQRSPFTHLVYPMPSGAWLGVHVTLDMAGRTRFGPDEEWVAEIDYRPDSGRAEAFAEAISRYWPGISAESLAAGYVGVRPRIVDRGEPPGDFAIHGPEQHGVAGLVNLFGIESPGLTASLAIGDKVAGMLGS